ncbi:MAG: glutaredoxin [Fusobacterium sp.]
MKLTVIGSHLCEGTRNSLEVLKEKNVEVVFENLSESLESLKKYLSVRETSEMYAGVRAAGGIGIPCFVFEDGTKTLDLTVILSKLD